MQPNNSLEYLSPDNLFLQNIAWILQCAGTGISYCTFTLSSVKWNKGMGYVCALNTSQQQGETQEA